MRIALDAMGGDQAPAVVVQGAAQAAQQFRLRNDEIILVGDQRLIEAELQRIHRIPKNLSIQHAKDVIGMHEPPITALKQKPDSSIRKCLELVRTGEADAVVSAGNTGAMVAGSIFTLGLLVGVRRPGIAAPFPTRRGGTCIVIDVGANIQCKTDHLLQYALMASIFSHHVYGKKSPRVGLLNIGEEELKGSSLLKETRVRMEQLPLNFIGNVEGRDIFEGECDVVVCDGFVGNVLLKTAEGLAETLMHGLRSEVGKGPVRRFGAWLLGPALRRLRYKADCAEYGGAPLLGVSGVCLKCHGRSTAEAISNGIRVAAEQCRYDVNQHIVLGLNASHLAVEPSRAAQS